MNSFFKKAAAAVVVTASVAMLAGCSSGTPGAIDNSEFGGLRYGSSSSSQPSNSGWNPFGGGGFGKVASAGKGAKDAAKDMSKYSSEIEGANVFAQKLTAAMYSEHDNKENMVFSPFSAWLPLSALDNSAEDGDQKGMAEALSGQDSIENLNSAAGGASYAMTSKMPIKIANMILCSDDYKLRKTFTDVFSEYYSGSVESADFSDSNTVKRINDWASKNTDGKIPSILDSLSEDAKSVVLNAVYFKDTWKEEFDKSDTRDMTFYGTQGSAEVPFMVKTSDMLYYGDDTMQIVDLPFKSGGGMVIILPDKDKASVNAIMEAFALSDSDFLAALFSEMSKMEGTLRLPKFEIASPLMKLNDAVESSGIDAFDEQNAPYTALFEGDNPGYIDEIVQKALIIVDEKGAEAAAVTAVSVGIATSVDLTINSFDMTCDSPFMFILYGEPADGMRQILFTGVVNTLGDNPDPSGAISVPDASDVSTGSDEAQLSTDMANERSAKAVAIMGMMTGDLDVGTYWYDAENGILSYTSEDLSPYAKHSSHKGKLIRVTVSADSEPVIEWAEPGDTSVPSAPSDPGGPWYEPDPGSTVTPMPPVPSSGDYDSGSDYTFDERLLQVPSSDNDAEKEAVSLAKKWGLRSGGSLYYDIRTGKLKTDVSGIRSYGAKPEHNGKVICVTCGPNGDMSVQWVPAGA